MAAPALHHGARVDEAAVMEEELKRLLARELHDRVAQTLTGMLVDVENFKAEEVGWADVVEHLDRVQTSTREVLRNLRQLLHDLRGEKETEDDFAHAVELLANRFALRTGIEVDVTISARWPRVLARHAHLNLYRIIEEALANIRMHSGARKASVALQASSPHELALVVRDDGRGLDTDKSRPVGLGTVGMRERALLIGGMLTIESQGGSGTAVRAIFPMAMLLPKDQPPSTELTIYNEVLA